MFEPSCGAQHYNTSTRKYSNKAGVTIDGSVDWGGVGGLEFLDRRLHVGGYFAAIIKHLVSTLGYKIGTSLRGAPFDWRLAPDGFSAILADAAYAETSYCMLHTASNPILSHIPSLTRDCF